MLDNAATRQGSDSRIEWRQADALDLPFDDVSFDVVCCQLGGMFIRNRVVGYVQARRAPALSLCARLAARADVSAPPAD
nr:methyltransferase domain-containing protein [Paraburkholderia sp. BL18I3N2]